MYNINDTADMLGTAMTVTATNYVGAGVISPTYNTLTAGDRIRFDVDGIGTGSQGLTIAIRVYNNNERRTHKQSI